MKTLKILAITLAAVIGLTCFTGCGIQDKLAGGMRDKMIGGVHDVIGDMQQQMQSQLGDKEAPDFEAAIDDFVSTSLNTKTLKIGDADKPNAAVWLKSGMADVYSSNESVAIISDGGKVTAVGEGSAYIIIWVDQNMFEVYLYNVVA